MTAKTGLSLDDLDLRKAQADAFPMTYVAPDGSRPGVVIHVLGAHSETVQNALAKLLNDRRRRDAVRIRAKPGAADYTPVEDDQDFGQRSAAARIAGWEGIAQAYSPELALKLCRSNPVLAAQVIEASDEAGNFTKPSSKG